MNRKTRIIPLVAAALVGLLGAGVVAAQATPPAQTPQATPGGQQQGTPQPVQADVAFVPIQAEGTSGVSGMAVLRSSQQQEGTEVYVGTQPPGGLPLLGASAEDLGEVVILEGTCGDPGAVVAVLDTLQPIYGDPQQQDAQATPGGTPGQGQQTPEATPENGQQQQGDPNAYGLAQQVSVQLTTLLDGTHIIGILERAQDDGAQALTPGTDLPEDRSLLACGTLTQGNMLSAGPGGDGGPSATPQATPQRTPSGTPSS